MEALRERFGKYHVLEKLAQGGMAEVYKVKTVGIAGFEKIQVLKRILPASAREGRFIRSFIDEARIAVELTHRNIVQVFDFGKADGELFLAMELIEGTDLRTAVARGVERDALIPIPAAAYIISEVAGGLDYAHKKTDVYGTAMNIVHCDVSPSNVMLSLDGYVKILDFGIARATFASALERRRLRGKPRYMAPEQTYGEPPTPAADVFALGIIAWELMTGLPLYRGPNLKAILEAVRTTTPPRVRSLNPGVPTEIDTAIATALAREPERRGSVADLLAACARTAMLGGSRKLAEWLAATTTQQPPQRPSLTASLATLPPQRPSMTASMGYAEIVQLDDEPPVRPSLTELTLPGVTHHGAELDDDDAGSTRQQLPIAEETSYDHLSLEPEAAAPGELLDDEAIDDDFAVLALPTAAVERRRAVIVAAELAGPHDELRPLSRALGELAYQRGGVVVEQEDAALCIAFGLEIAGEDDVATAMAWALDATTMVRDARDRVPELTLRIGARTGVVASARIPADALDEARGLAREAHADRPLFAGSAGRLTSQLFELHEVPALRRSSRRGKIFELLGPRSAERREQLVGRGAFIGRAAQLGELEAWYQRAIAADRRLVALVSGAAGTGKSRLLAELLARRRAHGEQRLIAIAASEAHQRAPFSLVVDLYQSALRLPLVRGRAARQQLLQRLQHTLADKLPADRARAVVTDLDRAIELRDGIGVGAPEVADLRPRIAAGLAVFRGVLADRERPLLAIIEDIHLADSASLEVLRHMLAVPARGPELLIMTTRPDGPSAPVSDVVLAVGDLIGSELRALIADRLGSAATPLNIAAVLARGGGNPLFVEELAQAVCEDGDDVPASARDVVAARIDRLSPRARTALRYAAVLGDSVRPQILDELIDHGDPSADTLSGATGDGLVTEIDELVAAGMLARAADGVLTFPRGLVREVVYEALSARSQRDCHVRVGRLLASRFLAGREESPAEIADHLERGGELAGAAAFWLRAGRIALTASDAPGAISAFTRTLQLERELGASTRTSLARRRQALAGREEAHRLLGDLAADPGDLDELAQLCDGEPARLADVELRRAQRLLRTGAYGEARAATERAEAHAHGSDRLRGEALRIRGEVLERLGQFADALAVVSAAGELFHRAGATHDEMAARIGRGRIHLLQAHYVEAREAYRPVLAVIDKTGDAWLERIVTNHLAVIEMCLGHFAVALTTAQRSLELCRRCGDRGREGDALSVIGIIYLEVGLFAAADAAFAEALELLARTGSRWSHADCSIYAGTCELRRGDPRGLARIASALDEARQLGALYLEANALVARAGEHLRHGDLAAAIDDAAAGTEVARAASLVGYEIQGHARHAAALIRQGDHAAALDHADRALALLADQPTLEGSEEEILLACAQVLGAVGDPRAAEVLARGRAGAERKLAAMSDAEWRAAYLALPEIAALLA